MARSSGTYTMSVGTVANYKGYLQPMSTALNAVLPRSADTGQVNWATVATEPASGVIRDFEIFAFNDTLQATAPIYVRVDYVSGNSTLNGPRVTVGSTTDGAGNLGGVTAPIFQMSAYLPSNLTRYVYASSDGSYLMFQFGNDPAAAGAIGMGAIVVERTRNADGTPNGQGYMVWRWSATSATATVWGGSYSRVFGAQTQPAQDFTPYFVVPNLLNTNSFFIGTTAYAFPAYGYATYPTGASAVLLAGFQNDFPRSSEITLTHYGQPMKFLAAAAAMSIPVPYMNTATAPTLSNSFCPILRWE